MAPSRRCAAALATTSRSRGTTGGCWPRCGPRSSSVGRSDANVLLLGEHGTGKEVVARWLHAASARSERAMIAVNLGAIPDGLFESELFGHVKGAFTDAKADRLGRFELADGGTLFLDEIANLP